MAPGISTLTYLLTYLCYVTDDDSDNDDDDDDEIRRQERLRPLSSHEMIAVRL